MPTTVHDSYPCACGLVLKQVTNANIASHLASAKHKARMETLANKWDHTSAWSGHPLWCGPCQRGLLTVRSPYCQPPPPVGGVGGYNHQNNGEEGEWRPPLLYANPLGHHVPALFIATFMRNDISQGGGGIMRFAYFRIFFRIFWLLASL